MLDIQTIVGANPYERALSSPGFAESLRLPGLQIKSVAADLAAGDGGAAQLTLTTSTGCYHNALGF